MFPESNPATNPVDLFRCYIAEKLVAITGVGVAVIYPALEWTNAFDKGDLILAVPRLRVKGNPQKLAEEWAAKVCFFFLFSCVGWMMRKGFFWGVEGGKSKEKKKAHLPCLYSSLRMSTSTPRYRQVYSSNSSFRRSSSLGSSSRKS